MLSQKKSWEEDEGILLFRPAVSSCKMRYHLSGNSIEFGSLARWFVGSVGAVGFRLMPLPASYQP